MGLTLVCSTILKFSKFEVSVASSLAAKLEAGQKFDDPTENILWVR
jgi:hypothetical protein